MARLFAKDGTLLFTLSARQVEILRKGYSGHSVGYDKRSATILIDNGLLEAAPLGGLRATSAGTLAVRLYDTLRSSRAISAPDQADQTATA